MKCNHDYECNEGQVCLDEKCENAYCINNIAINMFHSTCEAMDPKLKCLSEPERNDFTPSSCQRQCNDTSECGVHQICSKITGGCFTPRCHEKAQVRFSF